MPKVDIGFHFRLLQTEWFDILACNMRLNFRIRSEEHALALTHVYISAEDLVVALIASDLQPSVIESKEPSRVAMVWCSQMNKFYFGLCMCMSCIYECSRFRANMNLQSRSICINIFCFRICLMLVCLRVSNDNSIRLFSAPKQLFSFHFSWMIWKHTNTHSFTRRKRSTCENIVSPWILNFQFSYTILFYVHIAESA